MWSHGSHCTDNINVHPPTPPPPRACVPQRLSSWCMDCPYRPLLVTSDLPLTNLDTHLYLSFTLHKPIPASPLPFLNPPHTSNLNFLTTSPCIGLHSHPSLPYLSTHTHTHTHTAIFFASYSFLPSPLPFPSLPTLVPRNMMDYLHLST